MKRKLMIIVAAIMLVGGYAVYTAVENSILIQNVLADNTGDDSEGDENGPMKPGTYHYHGKANNLFSDGCHSSANSICVLEVAGS